MLGRLEGKELPELLSVWTLNVGQTFSGNWHYSRRDTPCIYIPSVYMRRFSQWHTMYTSTFVVAIAPKSLGSSVWSLLALALGRNCHRCLYGYVQPYETSKIRKTEATELEIKT